MQFKSVPVEKPDDMNFIFGQTHFIKTVEDLYETIVSTAPQMKFGIAFCEASGKCLIRHAGNDKNLIEIAKKNAENVACGHSFFIFMENGFPINILNAIKMVPEVCGIYCATANPTHVIVAENEQGRGVMGVIDGSKPKGIETDEDIKERKEFLRKIGYKM